jgi:p-cumate 2,3-dioxygenase beta subunit
VSTDVEAARATCFEAEQFLYREAALLDEWRLDDWLELWADDGEYTVPTTDHWSGTGHDSLVFIDDDVFRIRARVTRLNSRRAHREFPYSRTRRLISNVRVLEDRGDEVDIAANFVIYRVRRDTDAYPGQYLYTLRRNDDSFLIVRRRALLDLEALRPHGTLSIIL